MIQNHLVAAYSGKAGLLLFFLVFYFTGWTQPAFNIDHIETKQLVPMEHLHVLEDKGAQLTISDILASENQARFKERLPTEMRVQDLNDAYWIKFKLTGAQMAKQHWVLEAPDCNISYIDFYYSIDGVLTEVMQSGALRKHHLRNFAHKNFVFELPRTESEIVVYSRIQSNAQNQFLFHIFSYKYFTGYALSEYILLGAFYGILFIMGLYNFLFFMVNRTKINLSYCIYVLSCLVMCTIEDGLGFQFFWAEYPEVNYFVLYHTPKILLLTFLIYANQFLELNKRQPYVFRGILAVSFFTILFSLQQSSIMDNTFSGTFFIPFFLIYLATIRGIMQGFRPAKYFLVAFSFTIIGIFILCLRRYGSLDWSSLSALQIIILVYALNFGLLIEIVLLSIAQSLKIKDKQQAQKKILSDKEVRLRNIFNSSFDALLVYDPKSKIITNANNRASELFQYSIEEFKSVDINQIISLPPDMNSGEKATMNEMIFKTSEVKNNRAFEANCSDASEQIIACEITLSPLQEGNSRAVVIAIKDIRQRKEAERDLKVKMVEISEKNERLQAYISSNSELENFAYVASHDMKQPVRSIRNFTDILQKHLDKKNVLDAQSKQFINFIIGGATNLNNLITGLLEHSRISSVKDVTFKSADMNAVMDSVKLNLNQQISENNVTINYHDLPCMKLEQMRIIQLLQNLLSNAIKFRKKDVPCVIDINATEQKEHWMFEVRDNGIGMEKKYQDAIFQIFKKLHDSSTYSGNGIGLATCKKIAEQHGGTIWVESEPGVGTSFFFTLKKELDTFNIMLVPDKEKVLN